MRRVQQFTLLLLCCVLTACAASTPEYAPPDQSDPWEELERQQRQENPEPCYGEWECVRVLEARSKPSEQRSG